MKKNDSRAKQFLRGLLSGQHTLLDDNLNISLVVDGGETMLIHYNGRHKIMLAGGKGREINQRVYDQVKALEKAGRVRLFEITLTEESAGESWQCALDLWNSCQP
jgi:hypothetical protein